MISLKIKERKGTKGGGGKERERKGEREGRRGRGRGKGRVPSVSLSPDSNGLLLQSMCKSKSEALL